MVRWKGLWKWSSNKKTASEIYVVDKKYGAADPGYFVYFLKRDGNKIYFKKGHNGYDLGWF